MSVTAGVPSNFAAVLQDNGNAIALPSGSIFNWVTDDDTDQITVLVDDGSSVQITVTGANASRTQMTATADTTAPDGTDVSGSLTVDIIPGVTHTYTVSVSQVFTREIVGKKVSHHKK